MFLSLFLRTRNNEAAARLAVAHHFSLSGAETRFSRRNSQGPRSGCTAFFVLVFLCYKKTGEKKSCRKCPRSHTHPSLSWCGAGGGRHKVKMAAGRVCDVQTAWACAAQTNRAGVRRKIQQRERGGLMAFCLERFPESPCDSSCFQTAGGTLHSSPDASHLKTALKLGHIIPPPHNCFYGSLERRHLLSTENRCRWAWPDKGAETN